MCSVPNRRSGERSGDVLGGATDGDFTRFYITVRDGSVPVEDITLASTEVDAGDSLELVATTPEDI